MANLVDFNTCAMNDIHLQQRTACWKSMTSAHRTQFFYQVNCYYCCTAYMLIRSVMTHTQIRIISRSLSLSLSLSLSPSLTLLCFCCDLNVSSFSYSGSISLIIQIVTLTLETLRVALNTKTFISIP